MRVLHISGPGVATDDECCPHGQVMLDVRDGYHVGGLGHFDIRQQTGQQRIRVRRR